MIKIIEKITNIVALVMWASVFVIMFLFDYLSTHVIDILSNIVIGTFILVITLSVVIEISNAKLRKKDNNTAI